jgi:death-on-curing protein
VAQPQATFDGDFLHRDLFEMAAAYAFHIAENQPFMDGNKRTGLLAALVFLDINGLPVQDPEGRLYRAMLDIAEHNAGKAELAALLRDLAGVSN